MQNFAEQVPDKRLQKQLVDALSNNKPFIRFKGIIDDSDFRSEWFEFKNQSQEAFVKKQIDELNEEF